jgi:hypothetical protein
MRKTGITTDDLLRILTELTTQHLLNGEQRAGPRFTVNDVRDAIKDELADRASSDQHIRERLNQLIAQGRVKTVGIRLEKGPRQHRLFEIVRAPTACYNAFAALLGATFGASGKRFTAERVLALKGLPRSLTLAQVELWLVRMVRERRIRAVGFDRRNDVLFQCVDAG